MNVSLHPHDKKSRRITVLFSPKEYAEVREDKEKRGKDSMSVSAHMRELVLNAVRDNGAKVP